VFVTGLPDLQREEREGGNVKVTEQGRGGKETGNEYE